MSSNDLEDRVSDITVSFPTDENGFVGRQCSSEECEKYFKITPGTGLTEVEECRCPYCGHSEEPSSFFTDDQLEYAKSVAKRKVFDAIAEEFESMAFSSDGALFELNIEFETEDSVVIREYDEEDLETRVECDSCSLQYAIYGVFGYCPDCGRHNTLQILLRNFDLVRRYLTLAESETEGSVAESLRETALQKMVSVFDAWGHELSGSFHEQRASIPEHGISFQNIERARERLIDELDYDLAQPIAEDAFAQIHTLFQKQQLFTHNLGVIDEQYVERADDEDAEVGTKVTLSGGEIRDALDRLEAVARGLVECAENRTKSG